MSDQTLGALVKQALVGIVSGRVFPGQAPDSPTCPYVVYLYFGEELVALSGRADLQNRNLQIDIYDKTYIGAEDVADQIRDAFALQNHTGSPSSFTATPLSRASAPPDPDVKLHRITLEYSVWYRPGF